jgi:hypothetical protein
VNSILDMPANRAATGDEQVLQAQSSMAITTGDDPPIPLPEGTLTTARRKVKEDRTQDEEQVINRGSTSLPATRALCPADELQALRADLRGFSITQLREGQDLEEWEAERKAETTIDDDRDYAWGNSQ